MVVYVNDLSLIMGNWIELGVKVCDGVYDTIQIVCCMLKQKITHKLCLLTPSALPPLLYYY